MSAIVVPLQRPLVKGEPKMLNDPRSITTLTDQTHPSARIVYYLSRAHPRIVSRAELRKATGNDGKEPRHAAVFEWLILRANDTLPLTGWKIDEDREHYRLERIGQKHHERLLERHR